MKTIPLTQGKMAVVDDGDFDRLSKFKWQAQRRERTWYAKRGAYNPETRNNDAVLMHREVLAVPDGVQIDHRDGDGLNNQSHNLRPCNGQQNCRNQKKRLGCTSRAKGVNWDSTAGRWRAQIKLDGRRITLGYFRTEKEASDAYDRAAVEHFGEFANINRYGVIET